MKHCMTIGTTLGDHLNIQAKKLILFSLALLRHHHSSNGYGNQATWEIISSFSGYC
jgi:hypothetical protein